jgi:glycosyl transferase family 25
MNQFDIVYIISLPQSVQRYAKLSSAFDVMGMSYTKFIAINGYNVTIVNTKNYQKFKGLDLKNNLVTMDRKTIYEIKCNSDEIDFTLTGRKYNAGEIGLWCSHFMIWKESAKQEYKKVLVFEDDFLPKNQSTFVKKVNLFLQDLPNSFNVAYLYAKIQNGVKIALSDDLSHISKISEGAKWWLAMSYCFSPSFTKKMLANLHYNASLDGHITSYSPTLEVYISTEDLYDVSNSFESSVVSKMG